MATKKTCGRTPGFLAEVPGEVTRLLVVTSFFGPGIGMPMDFYGFLWIPGHSWDVNMQTGSGRGYTLIQPSVA